ncbi:MAG: phenylacetate-CoA oxygenase subunit PaaJ [Gammaproteobacteria bacterium]|nr:phenylacetate-CoA oxygenase subunit PaaJ [Gammaproteobacteria bacterium]
MVETQYRPEQILEWLSHVPDPEIPVLTITDLGIVRDVDCGEAVTVSLTPTYSGCPATEAIEGSVVAALQEHGVENVQIKRVLSPPWTTDWISEAGRKKLRVYGIAPPERRDRPIACPRCDSSNTEIVSEFGSTACKAAYRCTDCLEPFEYFKCL